MLWSVPHYPRKRGTAGLLVRSLEFDAAVSRNTGKTGSQTQRLSPKTLKALELAVIQIGVETAVREKGFVGTLLDDRTVVHYKNNVRVADS